MHGQPPPPVACLLVVAQLAAGLPLAPAASFLLASPAGRRAGYAEFTAWLCQSASSEEEK
jgi:hypothetical protein